MESGSTCDRASARESLTGGRRAGKRRGGVVPEVVPQAERCSETTRAAGVGLADRDLTFEHQSFNAALRVRPQATRGSSLPGGAGMASGLLWLELAMKPNSPSIGHPRCHIHLLTDGNLTVESHTVRFRRRELTEECSGRLNGLWQHIVVERADSYAYSMWWFAH